MKKRIIIGAFAVLAAIGLVFAFSACEGVLTWSVTVTNFQAQGTIVDAQSGGGIEGVTVTLTLLEAAEATTEEVVVEEGEEETEETKETEEDKTYDDYDDNTVYTATTDADGVFKFDADVESILVGEYTVEFDVSGYAFVPPQNVIITGDSDQNLGRYIGFPYTSDQQYDLKFILMWNETFQDVDIRMTYPTNDGNNFAFDHPYHSAAGGGTPTAGSGSQTGRESIYWNRLTTAGGSRADGKPTDSYDFDSNNDSTNDSFRAEIDVDDQDGRGPETITMRALPVNFLDSTGTISGGGDTGLPTSAGTFTWHGAAEIYADAYSSTGSGASDDDTLASVADSAGTNADAILYVFFGDKVKGIYELPKYTDIQTASLVRVNLFTQDDSGLYDYYQIVPDIRVFQDVDEARNISPSIINVQGRPRS